MTNDVCGGYFILFAPSNTTFVKHFIAKYQINTHLICKKYLYAGYGNTTSAINAIDFKFVQAT
jgi:hypothetical protein